MGRKNTFSRALHHLKSDDRIEVLEAAPTNNTMGLMTITPSVETQVETFKEPLDFSRDNDANDGENTDGIFLSDGTILTIEPPGDTSYVLGPMAAMWYAWGNFTRIGYIRQEDRKMVNLASITGELGSWDGSSNFTSYGQLTLAQADWFRTTPKKDGANNDTPNYRAFYPGPPSNEPDEFGRYLCVITGTPKEIPGPIEDRVSAPGQGPEDPTTQFSALLNKLKDQAADIDWDKISKGVETALTIADAALMVASLIGILVPEPATSAAGAAGVMSVLSKLRLANKARNAGSLAKGLKGMGVGATGLKSGGFHALKGGKGLHSGSKGLLSPGGKGVYSASKVGKVGPGGLRPGSGAARYTQAGSNPLSGFSKGGAGSSPGGVVGSVVPGGSRGINVIEPQRVVNPQTFKKGTQLFDKVMKGKYPHSKTAQKIRQMGQEAGFGPGQSNIPFSNLLKQDYDYNYGYFLIESVEDNQNAMIIKMMDNPKFVKRLPEIIRGLEDEVDLIQVLDMMGGIEGKTNVTESTQTLSEGRKWLREIRKPVEVPELPKKVKVKPRLKKKEGYKIVGEGLMKDQIAPPEFSSTRENRMWRKYEYNQNIRASQEKKNQVLELVGEGDHQWNYMIGNENWRTSQQMKKFYGNHNDLYNYYYGGKKHKIVRKEGLEKDFLLFLEDENGVKSTLTQSQLNELLAEERDKEDFKEYYMKETEQSEREKNFDRVTKLKSIVGRTKRGEIGPEYPKEPVPELINGWHPKFGKKYKHDKLDPQSAEAMPSQGDPEIDANIDKATDKKSKVRKLKTIMGRLK